MNIDISNETLSIPPQLERLYTGDQWLKALRADELVLARVRVAGDWGVEIERTRAAVFHFIIAGGAFVRHAGKEPVPLEIGDLILFPRGATHRLSQTPHGDTLSLPRFLAYHQSTMPPDVSDATMFVCGRIGVRRDSVLPSLGTLPEMLHIKASATAPSSAVTATLELLHNEIEKVQFASQILVQHLLSSLFIFVLREGLASGLSANAHWTTEPGSEGILRAILCIQEAPARAWSIAELADRAGLSRSRFIKQFQSLVGESPHSYLVRRRIDIATHLLETTGMRLAAIAERVGYQSPFALSRAFKKARHQSPTQMRASLRVQAKGW